MKISIFLTKSTAIRKLLDLFITTFVINKIKPNLCLCPVVMALGNYRTALQLLLCSAKFVWLLSVDLTYLQSMIGGWQQHGTHKRRKTTNSQLGLAVSPPYRIVVKRTRVLIRLLRTF